MGRVVADCDAKLARYRAALEAGTDPALVTVWTGQVQAERATALSRLRPTPTTRAMSHDEVRALVDGLGSARAVLMRADPDDKAEVYRQVGLQLTYQPDERTMQANIQIDPQSWGYGVCPRGS